MKKIFFVAPLLLLTLLLTGCGKKAVEPATTLPVPTPTPVDVTQPATVPTSVSVPSTPTEPTPPAA